eukprot:TRINITY_DN1943_c0_g1_i2.p1 TRINITY_DN1943_c0_g1~~TRINITY_DN1943_c0_g1_i2.p1  ORF type:complete len:775 (-),score=138.04 TRINITY_DN1943_c0_g1_i2:65-2389(-)
MGRVDCVANIWSGTDYHWRNQFKAIETLSFPLVFFWGSIACANGTTFNLATNQVSGSSSSTKFQFGFERFQNMFVTQPQTNFPVFSGFYQATCCSLIPNDPAKIVIGYADGDVVLSQNFVDADGKILIETFSSQMRMRGHVNKVTCCSVTADGSMIVSGSLDCTLRVWDTKTSAPIMVFPLHTQVLSCATSSVIGNKTFVSVGLQDGTTVIWNMEKPSQQGTQEEFPLTITTDGATTTVGEKARWCLRYDKLSLGGCLEDCLVDFLDTLEELGITTEPGAAWHPCSARLCDLLDRACLIPSGCDFSLWYPSSVMRPVLFEGIDLRPVPDAPREDWDPERLARGRIIIAPCKALLCCMHQRQVLFMPPLSNKVVVDATTCVRIEKRSFGRRNFILERNGKPVAEIRHFFGAMPFSIRHPQLSLYCKVGLGIVPQHLPQREMVVVSGEQTHISSLETLPDILLLEIFQHLVEKCVCSCHKGQVFVLWAVHGLCTLDLVCKRFYQCRQTGALSLTEETAKSLCFGIFGIKEKRRSEQWKHELMLCDTIYADCQKTAKLILHYILWKGERESAKSALNEITRRWGQVDQNLLTKRQACFTGEGKVLLSNGHTRTVSDLNVGDIVQTESRRVGRSIVKIEKSAVFSEIYMINVKGVWLTPGHPVLLATGFLKQATATSSPLREKATCSSDNPLTDTSGWVHPFEIFQTEKHFVEWLYNLELEGGPAVNDHSVIINGLVVCTLGKDCGKRIRDGWPKSDRLYGSGYWLNASSAWQINSLR